MRLLSKAAIALFVFYGLFLAGVAFWMEHSVQSVSRSLRENTARLIGNDIAAAIAKAAIDELRVNDPSTRARLEEIIEDITARSEVVSSLSVVDVRGKVVASDEDEVGRQVVDPALIFSVPGRAGYAEPGLLRQDNVYFLFVPLLDQKQIVGYLRLSLHSDPLTVVYKRGRRDFLIIALSGFAGLLVLLTVLRAVLQRRTSLLLGSFEPSSAQRFDSEAVGVDELSTVQESALRLGTQLAAAVRHATLAEQRLHALQRGTKAAFLFLNPDRSLNTATTQACDLFGDPEVGELEKRWNEVQALIEDAWDAGVREDGILRLMIELGDSKPPRSLQLEVLEVGEGGQHGFAVLVSDTTLEESLAADLAAALELRAVHAACVDAAGAVAEAEAVVDENLQSLRESLEQNATGAGADQLEQQTEYVDAIEDAATTLSGICQGTLKQVHPRRSQRAAFDLRDLLTETLSMLAAHAKKHRIRIEPPQLPSPVVLAAAYHPLKDAMVSILFHIVDWMPEGTVVAIDVDRDATRLSLTLRSTVASTLSAASWQLYEAYLLDDQGAARIGLRVARHAVAVLGGKLDIYTAAQGGSGYRITVPLVSKVTTVRPAAVAS